jgi:hypothetical protein
MYNPPPAGKPLSAMPLPAGVYTGLRMPCSRRFCSGKNASGVVWKYWLRVELSRASLARGEGRTVTTREESDQLAKDITRRGMARLAAEQNSLG